MPAKLCIDIGQVVILTMLWISLWLPAFTTQMVAHPYSSDPYTWYGWKVLIIGWAGVFDGTLAWYANPVLILSVLLLGSEDKNFKPKYIFYLSIIGLLLALSSLLYKKMWNDKDTLTIIDYGAGFYLWIIAFASTISFSILKIYISDATKSKTHEQSTFN